MIELADSSVWGKLHALDQATRAAFADLVRGHQIATCDHVVGEVLVSARGYEDLVTTRDQFAALPFCPIGPNEYQRAFAVMEAVAEGHRHRQATFADCLIAAAAESAGIGLLHYDADFDAIASLTGQLTRAVAPIGSLQWFRPRPSPTRWH